MTEKKCHNCGKEYKQLDDKGIFVKINKITGWFHDMICFDSWNKIMEGKYEGGIIEDMEFRN